MSTTTAVKTFFIRPRADRCRERWAGRRGRHAETGGGLRRGRTLRPWVERGFGKPSLNGSLLPFSFTYGGIPSAKCLPQWEYTSRYETLPSGWRQTTTYKDPKTGLAVQCDVTGHDDFDTMDWVFSLVNTGAADTPVIEQFLPLDCNHLLESPSGSVVLRWSNGDRYSPDSFLPHDDPLLSGQSRRFAPTGGRSSNGTALTLLQSGRREERLDPGRGLVRAVGRRVCPGLWRNGHDPPGMETTHFRLRPGQRVRTPRIVLLRYPGKRMILGHNRFRQLMLTHYVQRATASRHAADMPQYGGHHLSQQPAGHGNQPTGDHPQGGPTGRRSLLDGRLLVSARLGRKRRQLVSPAERFSPRAVPCSATRPIGRA